MMNRGEISRLAMITVLLALTGCAGMNRQECKVADWRLIGYQDGAAGKQASAIGNYRKQCAEHAVVPDLDAWLAGREAGLKEYCKPGNGYRLGMSGRGYNAVCPPSSAGAFHSAYADGRSLYNARAAVNSTRDRIEKRELEVGSLQHEKDDKLAALLQPGLRNETRVMILIDVHRIEQDIDGLQDEIHDLRQALTYQQSYLETLSRR